MRGRSPSRDMACTEGRCNKPNLFRLPPSLTSLTYLRKWKNNYKWKRICQFMMVFSPGARRSNNKGTREQSDWWLRFSYKRGLTRRPRVRSLEPAGGLLLPTQFPIAINLLLWPIYQQPTATPCRGSYKLEGVKVRSTRRHVSFWHVTYVVQIPTDSKTYSRLMTDILKVVETYVF